MTMPRCLLLAMVISDAAALCIQKKPLVPQLHVVQRRAHVQLSAAVLPVAYTSAAAGLAWRAAQATTRADVGVLLSTALLAVVDLAPTAAAQLASSKRAIAVVPPASTGIAKERRYAAKKWHFVVRFKIAGQLCGLLWMLRALDPAGVLRGAACILFSNLSFWLLGAGQARHDGDGGWAPVPTRLTRTIGATDAVICALAFAGSLTAPGLPRFDRLSKMYSILLLCGVIENFPSFAKGLPVWLGIKSAPAPPPPSLGGPTD